MRGGGRGGKALRHHEAQWDPDGLCDESCLAKRDFWAKDERAGLAQVSRTAAAAVAVVNSIVTLCDRSRWQRRHAKASDAHAQLAAHRGDGGAEARCDWELRASKRTYRQVQHALFRCRGKGRWAGESGAGRWRALSWQVHGPG